MEEKVHETWFKTKQRDTEVGFTSLFCRELGTIPDSDVSAAPSQSTSSVGHQ